MAFDMLARFFSGASFSDHSFLRTANWFSFEASHLSSHSPLISESSLYLPWGTGSALEIGIT